MPTSSLCHIKIAARTIRGADGGNAHKPRLLYSSSDERTTDRHGRVAELLCSLKDRLNIYRDKKQITKTTTNRRRKKAAAAAAAAE